jgi:hypothetical protein
MPDLPSSPENLKFVPDKNRLFPKFQSYKLQSYSEDSHLKRISLPVPPCRPVLPNNARVGFQDVRVRTGWNHLSQSWDAKSVLYVGTGGEVVRIQQGQARVIGAISMSSRVDVYGYYPDVVEVAPDLLVATDGLGGLFVLRNGTVIGSLQENIPFILFDAKLVNEEIDILTCSALQSETETSKSQPPRGEYQVRILRLNLSSALNYTISTSLSGTEIPKHAFLSPDIVIITQSPFRFTSAPSNPEELELDIDSPPPPLYTYYQNLTDLDISIPLPLGTSKSLIQVNFSTSTLQIHFLPPRSPGQPDLSETFPFQTAEEKPLWGAIDPMNSTWTLSSTSTTKVLDIHLEKLPEEQSHWPQVFEDPDGAEEYTDPSDRRDILDRLEKYTQSSSPYDDGEAVRRRFLLEEDEDIDSVEAGDLIQLFSRGTHLSESRGHDLLAIPFNRQSMTLGIKVSIDMCVFDVTEGHVISFPAFGFVASSKRLRKYCRYMEEYAVIVESGRGGNMYVYYLPQDGLVAKQVVVKLDVESLGVGVIRGEGIVVLGEGKEGFEGVVVGGL